MASRMALPYSSAYSLPLRTSSFRCLRCEAPRRLFSTARPRPQQSTTTSKNPLRNSKPNAGYGGDEDARLTHQQLQAKYKRSMYLCAAGIAGSAVGTFVVIKMDPYGIADEEGNIKKEFRVTSTQQDDGDGKVNNDGGNANTDISSAKMQLDVRPGTPEFPSTGGPAVIRIPGQDESLQQVPTGNSSVPYFPTTIRLPTKLNSVTIGLQQGDELASSTSSTPSPTLPEGRKTEEEYQLLGLGIRAVTFIRFQVYVVGLYVAKSDIPELQKLLVRTAIHPPGPNEHGETDSYVADAATSLVPGERERLKEALLDPEQSSVAWNSIIQNGGRRRQPDDPGVRTVLRVVPTRNTDFMHLRDGWVRGVTGRANAAAQNQNQEFHDESFGESLNNFKALFGGGMRKNVAKGQVLLLHRNAYGVFDALYEPSPNQPPRWMGRVTDERISRLVWLHYLGGKTVASEPARKSIVEGVMGVVERPIGTV